MVLATSAVSVVDSLAVHGVKKHPQDLTIRNRLRAEVKTDEADRYRCEGKNSQRHHPAGTREDGALSDNAACRVHATRFVGQDSGTRTRLNRGRPLLQEEPHG